MTGSNEKDFQSAQKALRWFISELGELEWKARRKKVVDYFRSLKAKQEGDEINRLENIGIFDPIAVYTDWLSWYMYLIECQTERLGCDDPNQSARIYYFFVLIGGSIETLKKISGIEKRMHSLLHENKNQADSAFYEFSIALLYHQNGWKVRFVDETPLSKTPDLEVQKGIKKYWVECKRLSKINQYAEDERQAWMKRSLHLFKAMQLFNNNCFAEIIFKKPVEETVEIVLGSAFAAYNNLEMFNEGKWLSNEQLDFRVRELDLDQINATLFRNSTRPTAPLMLKYILGDFDLEGNYAFVIKPTEIEIAHPDDELAVLNEFYASVAEVNVAKWECIAPESVDGKAKYFKKIMSKALEQIPEEGEGIIHIGYETVTGPAVEVERYKKNHSDIQSFNFANKNISAVYLNAFQMRPDIKKYDCAETVSYYLREPVLEKALLFNSLIDISTDGTHWDK
ncbi:MAG: hypothetical protein JNK08_00325 [Sediminibacterium sp.]|nr:hypothetical protein [Sediminibacterium sp.]